MSDFDINIRDNDREFTIATGDEYEFVLGRWPVYVLEVPDVHFHHNSAVMLPDCATDDHEVDGQRHDDYAGLAVLGAALRYAKEHAERLALILGHADPSGEPPVNNPLSLMRAKSVFYLLQGSEPARDEWRQLSDERSKVEDYQLVLKFFAAYWSWSCDAGPVDNIRGNQTRSGVRRFQEIYNGRVAGRPLDSPIAGDEPGPDEQNTETDSAKHLGVDGIFGPNTWGAVFDVYQHTVRDLLAVDESRLQALRDALQFVDDTKKTVGCGEYFPIQADERDQFEPNAPTSDDQPTTDEDFDERARRLAYRSHEDRRVEIRFFEPAHKPDLDCHPDEETWSPEKCHVCNGRLYRKVFIPVTPESLEYKWAIRFFSAGTSKLADRPPLANESCTIKRASGGELSKSTDQNGLLEFPVMDDDEDFVVEIAGQSIQFFGGDLPRLSQTDANAIKHRLWNLGFGAADPEQWDDDTYRNARRAFKKRELDVDDDVFDDATVEALRDRHGS